MRGTLFDRQQTINPSSGIPMNDPLYLRQVLDKAAQREPFFCELVGDNGYKLLIGIGKHIGCVQHSANDGSPPYLMALAGSQSNNEAYANFLMGDTVTPVPTQYCFPFDKVKDIAGYFLETGQRDPTVNWEEI